MQLKQHEQLSWPQVEGNVLAAYETFYHTFVIDYEYTVNGTVYHGDSVAWFWILCAPRARISVEKYTEGKTVQVFYDPLSPASCLLEPRVTWPFLLFFLFVLAMAFSSLLIWVIYTNRKTIQSLPAQ
uniref:DUF3592 domain-containing protein n=1 Tax=Vannella robusta TaxID=1487602 RepID=A0A7S4I4J0_9EUKA